MNKTYSYLYITRIIGLVLILLCGPTKEVCVLLPPIPQIKESADALRTDTEHFKLLGPSLTKKPNLKKSALAWFGKAGLSRLAQYSKNKNQKSRMSDANARDYGELHFLAEELGAAGYDKTLTRTLLGEITPTPASFARAFIDNSQVEAQLKLIERDFYELIKNRLGQEIDGVKVDRSFVIAGFGLGSNPYEAMQLTKSFFQTLKLHGQKPMDWTLTFRGFDIDSQIIIDANAYFTKFSNGQALAFIGLGEEEYTPGMIDMQAIQADIFNFENLSKKMETGGIVNNADYITYRHVGYINHWIESENAESALLPLSDASHPLRSNSKKLLETYVGPRNILTLAAKPESRFITEPGVALQEYRDIIPSGKVFAMAGLKNIPASALSDASTYADDSIYDQSSGIYVVKNLGLVHQYERERRALQEFQNAILATQKSRMSEAQNPDIDENKPLAIILGPYPVSVAQKLLDSGVDVVRFIGDEEIIINPLGPLAGDRNDAEMAMRVLIVDEDQLTNILPNDRRVALVYDQRQAFHMAFQTAGLREAGFDIADFPYAHNEHAKPLEQWSAAATAQFDHSFQVAFSRMSEQYDLSYLTLDFEPEDWAEDVEALGLDIRAILSPEHDKPISHPLYIGEYSEIRKRVNPNHDDVNLVYAASGDDIITALITTDATTLNFVDKHVMQPDRLNEALNQWRKDGDAWHIDVYESMAFTSADGMGKINGQEQRLIYKLKALGVKLQNIRIDESPGKPTQLKFEWNYLNQPIKSRKLVFIRQDITDVATYTDEFQAILNSGVDGFMLKAALRIPEKYDSFLEYVSSKTKRFMILNNWSASDWNKKIDPSSHFFESADREWVNSSDNRSQAEIRYRDSIFKFLIKLGDGYSVDLDVYLNQKASRLSVNPDDEVNKKVVDFPPILLNPKTPKGIDIAYKWGGEIGLLQIDPSGKSARFEVAGQITQVFDLEQKRASTSFNHKYFTLQNGAASTGHSITQTSFSNELSREERSLLMRVESQLQLSQLEDIVWVLDKPNAVYIEALGGAKAWIESIGGHFSTITEAELPVKTAESKQKHRQVTYLVSDSLTLDGRDIDIGSKGSAWVYSNDSNTDSAELVLPRLRLNILYAALVQLSNRAAAAGLNASFDAAVIAQLAAQTFQTQDAAKAHLEASRDLQKIDIRYLNQAKPFILTTKVLATRLAAWTRSRLATLWSA